MARSIPFSLTMKTLKFTRDVAVYAIHRAQGSVHQIEDIDALQLIQDGAAIEAEIETAVAKPAKKETATKR